jgi:hypothetical protein
MSLHEAYLVSHLFLLQAGIYRFAFQREHSEGALMRSAQWLLEHATTDIACMCWFMAAVPAGNDSDLLLADLFCIVARTGTLCPDNRTEPGCNTDSPCSISSTASLGRLMSFFMKD